MAELNSFSLKNDANLVAYYRFEAGALTTDSSGNSNTLTNVNTVTEGTGKYGGGADFELSSAEHFSLADASQTGLDFTGATSISIAGWLKLESAPGSGGIYSLVNKWDSGTQQYLVDYFNNSGTKQLRWIYRSSAALESSSTFNVDLGTGTWVHVAVVADLVNKTALAYINGSSSSFTFSGTNANAIYNTASTFWIGKKGDGTSYFDGIMDDLCLFSRALTETEIGYLYGLGPSSSSNFFLFF